MNQVTTNLFWYEPPRLLPLDIASFARAFQNRRPLLFRAIGVSLFFISIGAMILSAINHSFHIALEVFLYFGIVLGAIGCFIFVAFLGGIVISLFVPPTVRVYSEFISFEKPLLTIKLQDVSRLILRRNSSQHRILIVESSSISRTVRVPDRIDIRQLREAFGDRLEIVEEFPRGV
jgi:hypothetical protein